MEVDVALDHASVITPQKWDVRRGVALDEEFAGRRLQEAHVKRICVFAGTRRGVRHSYTQAAKALARELLHHNVGLIFGGSTLGLMGVIATQVLEGGGEVIGVLPKQLLHEEAAYQGITELHIVQSLQERKLMMYDLADAFISLPGGLGTLDETLDVVSLLNIGMVAKPVGLLDVRGFYDPLVSFVQLAAAEGFVSPDWSTKFVCDSNAPRLVSRILSLG